MGYVRSFEGFAPPPRYDVAADPFTKVKIEESDASDGTFVVIETITLTPVDADPAHPKLRNLSTENATHEPGWYRITWEDASGSTASAEPMLFPRLPSWAPTIADVASLIRARTKDTGGVEAGTFTPDTRPTDAEVERLIEKAALRVQTSAGSEPCSESLRSEAGDAAALYAAMLIEQSYYPEQTTGTGNSFASLKALWDAQIKTLVERVNLECGGGGVDEDPTTGGIQQKAYGYFGDRELIGPDGSSWPL